MPAHRAAGRILFGVAEAATYRGLTEVAPEREARLHRQPLERTSGVADRRARGDGIQRLGDRQPAAGARATRSNHRDEPQWIVTVDSFPSAPRGGRVSRQHANLNRRRWAWVRRRALKRDNWRCQSCGRNGNEFDHVTPLDRGGAPCDESNLQCLCRGCHIVKTRAEYSGPRDPAWEAWRALVDELMIAGSDGQ